MIEEILKKADLSKVEYKPFYYPLVTMIRLLYELPECGCGGLGHVVLDDNNIDTASIQHTLHWTTEDENVSRVETPLVKCIMEYLLQMTEDERAVVFYLMDYEDWDNTSFDDPAMFEHAKDTLIPNDNPLSLSDTSELLTVRFDVPEVFEESFVSYMTSDPVIKELMETCHGIPVCRRPPSSSIIRPIEFVGRIVSFDGFEAKFKPYKYFEIYKYDPSTVCICPELSISKNEEDCPKSIKISGFYMKDSVKDSVKDTESIKHMNSAVFDLRTDTRGEDASENECTTEEET